MMLKSKHVGTVISSLIGSILQVAYSEFLPIPTRAPSPQLTTKVFLPALQPMFSQGYTLRKGCEIANIDHRFLNILVFFMRLHRSRNCEYVNFSPRYLEK